MRQRTFAMRAAALALVVLGAGVTLAASRSEAAPSATRAEAKHKAAKSTAMRQFTGVVTALEKSSITVERRGKRARTMVFDRGNDTKTTGDLAKESRVTVYYRDEGGKAVAHRVVVKDATKTASSSTRRR